MTEKGIRKFSSKILLFGEYLLLCGSKALSIPFPKYSGYFQFEVNGTSHPSNKSLRQFLNYLKKVNHQIGLDLESFTNDLEKGIIFNSNIPHGYGLGSSGSLSAALYDRYAQNKILNNTTKEIARLKKIFSLMESFFHGKSSGLDPLISYLDKPVLVSDQNHLERVSLPFFDIPNNDLTIFLLDYGIPGDTGPLVNHFINRCHKESFKKAIEDKVIPINNKAIEFFLNGDFESLIPHIKKLSDATFSYFKEMIPAPLLKKWQSGIEHDDYYLKLCGSGGGGMMLGFTGDFEKSKNLLKEYKLEKVTP